MVASGARRKFLRVHDCTLLLLLPGRDELHPHVLNVACIVTHIEDEWLDLACLRLLVDVVDEAALALDAPVGDLADLLRVERLPRLVVQVLVERHDIYRVHEVDEGVADVAAIVEVEGQVEKVIVPLMQSVYALQEHILCVFVRDVPDHDGCARVFTLKDPVEVDSELRIGVMVALLLSCIATVVGAAHVARLRPSGG